jgi:hypothetical protein
MSESWGPLYEQVSKMDTSNYNNALEYTLTVNTEGSYTQIRRLEMSVIRILYLIRKLSGNESLDTAIMKMQQAIMTIRSLQIALHALQAARAASGDPTAWLYFGATAIGVGLSTLDMSGYDAQRGT